MNSKLLNTMPININWYQDINSSVFHLQYMFNNEDRIQISRHATQLAFELCFIPDPARKDSVYLPASFIKDAQNKYMIESVGKDIIKLTLQPEMQIIKGQQPR